ncbi:MAG: hypothetical protein D3922_15695, partial [Candidatus Electrothrix sp. AR1]|nr:hypothetical protein [Candidatus Electrothrix sp. AR1]
MSIFGKSSDKLIKRCDAAKIEYEENEQIYEEEPAYFTVSLKAGRHNRDIYFGCEKEIDNFLTIDFEDYSFFDKYNAIYSISNNVIESIIFPLQEEIVSIYVTILKYKKFTEYLNRNDYPRLTIKDSDKHIVSIGPCSNELELLTKDNRYMSNCNHNKRYPRI